MDSTESQDEVVRNLCLHKTLIRIEGDPKKQYRIIPERYTKRLAKDLRETWDKSLVEILNERFIHPVRN